MNTIKTTKELLKAKFMLKKLWCFQKETEIGFVRTGMDWFDRYTIYPWEYPEYFELQEKN